MAEAEVQEAQMVDTQPEGWTGIGGEELWLIIRVKALYIYIMLYSGIYIYAYIYIVSDASPASLLLPHQPSGLVASQDSKDRPLERFSEEMGLKCGIPPPPNF